MSRLRHEMLTTTLLFAAVCLILSLPGCKTGSREPLPPSVIIVDKSLSVQLTDTSRYYCFDRPGVWMDRGRYLQLLDLELALQDGRLAWTNK